MRRLTMFGLLFFAFLFVAAVAQADWLVGLTHGTAKQRPEFSFTPLGAFALESARNEWEPFQVLIRDDVGLTNVNVEITDFTGPGAAIGGVELYREHYVPVSAEQVSHIPPDPSKGGDWPDGLVPFRDHYLDETRSGAPFDVAADYTMAVFGDIYVPEDQAPGDYTATVTVTADGRTPWTGTLTLTVWDFVLPNGISIGSSYGYSEGSQCNWHASHGGVTDCTTLTKRYYEEFARHRIALDRWGFADPLYSWNADTQTFDWDWTPFDEAHAPYFDGDFYRPGYKFTGYTLSGPPGGRPPEVDPLVWEREWWAGWADHFREQGWIETLWYYLPDEPTPDEYPALRDLAARLHAADPDIQPLVTEQFQEELAGDIDIWCPDEPLFSDSFPWPPYPEVYDDRRALGEKTWWYNCVSAIVLFDYANHFVDFESSYQRIWTWLTRRYRFEGLLFWRANYITALGLDAWDSQYAPPFCQGDGTIIYPGTIDRIGGTTDIPVASLRMKYHREAMEDYEYFHLLDERGDGAWIEDVVRTVAPKTYQWEHDWRKLLDWRRKVARKILGDLDETPPGPPTDLAATPVVGAIGLTWTPPAEEDLAGYEIWYGLYEGDQFYGGEASAGAAGAVVEGLTPGREYHIWMKAFDQDGNRSIASEEVTATPLAESAGDDALSKGAAQTQRLADDGSHDNGGRNGDDDEDAAGAAREAHDPNSVSVAAPSDDNPAAAGCGGW